MRIIEDEKSGRKLYRKKSRRELLVAFLLGFTAGFIIACALVYIVSA